MRCHWWWRRAEQVVHNKFFLVICTRQHSLFCTKTPPSQWYTYRTPWLKALDQYDQRWSKGSIILIIDVERFLNFHADHCSTADTHNSPYSNILWLGTHWCQLLELNRPLLSWERGTNRISSLHTKLHCLFYRPNRRKQWLGYAMLCK